MKIPVLLLVCCLPVAALAQAPRQVVVKDPTPVELPASRSLEGPAISLPTAEKPEVPARSLGLAVGESLRVFDIKVQNAEEQPLKVFAAQTTSGLYLVDFPRAIPAKGEGAVTVVYLAKPGSSGTADLVRLLTDRGEKTVQIDHGRAQVVSLDASSLQWKQGDKAGTKSVIITVAGDATVPKGVRAMGVGNTAAIEALGNNRYRVDITPASTAKAQQFPVFIQFAPELPGVNAVITCSVTAAD